MKRQRFLISLFLLSVLLAMFQNCGEGFEAGQYAVVQSGQGSENSQIETGNEKHRLLMPTEPNLLSDCMDNPNFNACLFWKNPVAQSGAPLAEKTVSLKSDLSGLQTHAVNLNLDGVSGELSSQSFHMVSWRNNTLEACNFVESGIKFSFLSDPICFTQVFAFYWLQFQENYMKENAGGFYVSGKNIKVVTYVPKYFMYGPHWDTVEEVIRMPEIGDGISAESYAHEVGHANLHYATGGQIENEQGVTNFVKCAYGNCCASADGCSGAINEGQADYHYALLFPTNTAIGEAYVNKVEGMSSCDLSRSLDHNSNISSEQAYKSCGVNSGEVHAMGIVYASVWWEVRKQVIAQMGLEEVKNFNALFTEHLTVLAAADDFSSALAKIRSVDQALFAAKFGALFTTEFARRGVQ